MIGRWHTGSFPIGRSLFDDREEAFATLESSESTLRVGRPDATKSKLVVDGAARGCAREADGDCEATSSSACPRGHSRHADILSTR